MFQGSQSNGRVSLAVIWQENLSLYTWNRAVMELPHPFQAYKNEVYLSPLEPFLGPLQAA